MTVPVGAHTLWQPLRSFCAAALAALASSVGPSQRASGHCSAVGERLPSLGRQDLAGVSGGCAFSFLLLYERCLMLSNPLPRSRTCRADGQGRNPGGANFQERNSGASRSAQVAPIHGEQHNNQMTGKEAHGGAGGNHATLHPGCPGASGWASSLRLGAGTVDSRAHSIPPGRVQGSVSKAASLLFSQSGPPTRLRNIIIFANMPVTWMEF